MVDCPECGAMLDLTDETEEGELIICTDCGADLEVTGTSPWAVQLAPKEEEDWGE